ncbi:MAG: hypothetical protein CBD76_02650 [Pelagibacteraceae bacterium TMED216]|nr:MAG: hypothetical protein CBD76_02650 [Pelagibacteraceae bacterium TMED216]|tara:strand:+ start:562 stop:1452 length:891 start_codon:yes stop_codon:yes gene_type:complete
MQDDFLKKRKLQEDKHFKLSEKDQNVFNSLVVIEINLTELCNRKCVFCPRVDPKVFPNRNLHMDLNLTNKIATNLKMINYKGRLSFSGFGEPLLTKNLLEHLKIFRSKLKLNNLETNTNGDKLNPSVIQNLFKSGLTNLYINAYDGPHQIEKFEKMIKDSGINKDYFYIRPHWEGYHKDWGLFLNNRSGMVKLAENDYLKPVKQEIKRKCFYPFYKMFIDFDGRVLFCSNDWGRINIVGNVNTENIEDIWLGEKLNFFRKKLSNEDRSNKPCNTCSINGTLHGKTSYDLLTNHFKF